MFKKFLAPIIIAILMLLYLGFWLYFTTQILAVNSPIFYLGAIIPLALGGVMLFVTIQRIKEIRSGEEDDLSKY